VNPLGRIAYVALDLFLFDLVCRERKRHRRSVSWLRLERTPIDRAPIEPRRCPRFQPTDGKSEILQRLGQLD
jgi:hypothetical protein